MDALFGDWQELLDLLVKSKEEILQQTFASFPKWYTTSNAFVSSVPLLILFILWCYLNSEITGNCSQVDRLWSIIPPIYALHFLATSYLQTKGFDERLLLMCLLNISWGLRLSYNFARKGGYKLFILSGDEDYRWEELRKRMPWIAFKVFNLLFIAGYQNILIWLFTLPTYIAWRSAGKPLTILDYISAFLFVSALIGETIADQQMWNFQREKHRLIREKKTLTGDFKLGFLTQGLFRYSRHPNFLFEQLIWWSYFLFTVAATGIWINWSILGAFLLTLLFQGSTWFTELVTCTKYPKYKEYQKHTSFMFWFPGSEDWKKD